MLKPCIRCGTPASGTHCTDCKPADTTVRTGKGHAATDWTWRKISTTARRHQPWCEDCGAVDDLTADHILPKHLVPALVHAIENLTVRCRSCNSRRGTTGVTLAEAQAVHARLQTAYARTPTRSGRDRLDAAERAVQDLGGTPSRVPAHPAGKAQGGMKTTMIFNRG